DLGFGGRQHGDQRGLARRGEAQQADVGHRTQFEDEVPLLAFLSEQREAGGLACAGGESGVAQTAASAFRGDERRARTDEVGQHLALLGEHDRAFGDAQFEGFARGAVAVAALALFAVTRTGVRAEVKVEKGVHAGVDDEEDVAALTAVAAVGSAERLELLPVHGGTAIAAGTRGEMDHRPVDESGCHGVPSCTDDAYGARRRTTTNEGRDRICSGPAPRRSYWWCWSGRSALDRNHVD